MQCSTRNDKLNDDDYKIIALVINNAITPDNYLDDIALARYKKVSEQYRKAVIDLLENNAYESTYYFSMDDSTFTYKSNEFFKALFVEYDFRSEVPKKMTSQKIDFTKVKLRKNLVRIQKNEPLSKSTNYIGDFRLSTIMHDRNKATIIFEEKETNGNRKMYFLKKEDGIWIHYGGNTIPVKYYNEVIKL